MGASRTCWHDDLGGDETRDQGDDEEAGAEWQFGSGPCYCILLVQLSYCLQQLGVETAIDQELKYQPEVATTYGRLAQVVIFNRMSLNPQPLYQLADWVARHGIDRLLGLQAAWLDDDRLDAMLDGLAAQQVAIWSTIIGNALREFQPDFGMAAQRYDQCVF